METLVHNNELKIVQGMQRRPVRVKRHLMHKCIMVKIGFKQKM